MCRHVCLIVLIQLSFYILCVFPTPKTGRNVTHKVTPVARHTTVSRKHLHTKISHKSDRTVKPAFRRTQKFHNVTTTPPANISSDELYVDSSAEAPSESASYEVIYANETDVTANDTTYWLNLEDAFEILSQKKYDHMSSVHALMNSYNFFSRKKRFRPLQHGRQQPFIIIEGLENELRSTLAEHVAELLEGKVVLNPTSDFKVILKHFGNNTELQRCYVSVTTYVTAMNARKTIETDPAITPGYYLTEAAYVASQLYFPHLPPKNSSFWTWPADLFKPDIIFYFMSDVDFNPNEELDPETLILKNSIMQILTLWEDPPCIAIHNKQNYSCMLEEMVPHLNTVLKE